MKQSIAVTFLVETESSEQRLGSIEFIEHYTEQGWQIFRTPPTQFALPDSTHIEIFATYLPSSDGTSLVVCHEAKQIALVLTDWERETPILASRSDN